MNNKEKIELIIDVLNQVLGPINKIRKEDRLFKEREYLTDNLVVVHSGYNNGPDRAIAYDLKTGKIDIAT